MNTNTRSIALIGATGKAGSAILRELLASGYAVRALARHPAKLDQPGHPGLELIQGDATDLPTLERVLAGCTAVVNAASSVGNPAPLACRLTRAILPWLEDDPGRRYLALTGKTVEAPGDVRSLSTLIQGWMLRRLFAGIMADKQREMDLLRQSAGAWTLIRCPLIVDGSSAAYQFNSRTCRGQRLTKLALARFIGDELRQARNAGQSPFVWSSGD